MSRFPKYEPRAGARLSDVEEQRPAADVSLDRATREDLPALAEITAEREGGSSDQWLLPIGRALDRSHMGSALVLVAKASGQVAAYGKVERHVLPEPSPHNEAPAGRYLAGVIVRPEHRREIKAQRDHEIQYWPMFLRDTGELAGCCGLRPHDVAGRVYELDVHIRRVHWGKGLALESSRAVIAHAFRDRGAAALFAGHHPENRTSGRLLERLGFRRTHEEIYPPTGLMHPSYRLEAPSPAQAAPRTGS